MNQPPLDRAAFLRTLRRCHTEEQLFSRLTFACLAQYDEAQRPELLDDVRGAAYSLRLPAVEYKTDQWLHRCQDAIDTDRDAFLAAANAEARRENDKMRAQQTPVGPGVLAESRLGSMASNELRTAVMQEIGCSDRTYERAYADLVRSGDVKKHTIRQKDGKNRWYSYYSGTSGEVPKL